MCSPYGFFENGVIGNLNLCQKGIPEAEEGAEKSFVANRKKRTSADEAA
jgi:hypothetical protein